MDIGFDVFGRLLVIIERKIVNVRKVVMVYLMCLFEFVGSRNISLFRRLRIRIGMIMLIIK